MQKIISKSLVVVALVSLQSVANARAYLDLASDPALKIMPIAGYETVYRDSPTPHTSTNVIYGLRLSYGVPALSGEAEYTRGNDVENYTVAPERIHYEDEKAKLGLSSAYHPISFFFVNIRAGGQASRGTKEVTSGGVTVKTTKELEYHPYAGAGLGFHLGQFLTLSATSTVVFKDYKDMKKNDVQNMVALSIGIN
jgi:hypothetical protein